MRRRLAVLPALTAAALALPGVAHAGFWAAEPVDGPGVDMKSVEDLDVARDGTGAVAYVRGAGGVDHAFVSRLVNGQFQAPEHVSAGLGAPVSEAAVAASDGGRVVAVFVSGGALFATLRPAADQPFTAPQLLATGASDPSVDMSIHGVAYTSFTLGGDVRLARLNRQDTAFNVLAEAADVEQAREAGVGTGRSKIAVNAEGSALVVFGERVDGQLRAIGRRVFRDRVSAAPQDMTLGELDGRPGGAADLPEVDVEDDSSYAWVAFRQAFGGQARAIGRRLVGSAFETAVVGDAIATGGPDSVATTRVELNGRGEGMLTVASAGGTSAAVIKDDDFNAARVLGGGGATSQTIGGVGENLDRVVTWIDGTEVRGAHFDDEAERRTQPDPGPVATISNPALGPVDPSAGFDMAVNRVGDATAVFVQGVGPERRLMAAGWDRPPGYFATNTTSTWRKFARPPLAWQPALDLNGPVTYQVLIGNQVVAETTATKVTLPNPVPDGIHNWRVVALDRRGQPFSSATRLLRVDATPPKATVRTRRKGSVATVTVKANDVIPPSGRASGVGIVRIAWGDGVVTTNPRGRKAAHRYGRRGRVTIRVSVTDRAGNATVFRKRLTIK